MANQQKANALLVLWGWAEEMRPAGLPQKDVKKNERSLNVYENKGNADKMPAKKSDIYVDMTSHDS